MIGQPHEVAVVVAAWNAAETIGRAISSALCQTQVVEVVVVDDASTDHTLEAARSGDDATGRLKVVPQKINCGPGAARNHAIALSRAPFIAVLDADDYFLPNRFTELFRIPRWDLIADNIAFVKEGHHLSPDATFCEFKPEPTRIDLSTFVKGNISRFSRPRAELGFMKAVMRRDFLEQNNLKYDEKLRLGEDYALYCSALAVGARLVRSKTCGYVAVERSSSLSGSHRTRDLEALLEFDDNLSRMPGLSLRERRAVNRHSRQLLAKVHHRRVLDSRRIEGLAPALAAAIGSPALMPHLALAVTRDKFVSPRVTTDEVRYLFP